MWTFRQLGIGKARKHKVRTLGLHKDTRVVDLPGPDNGNNLLALVRASGCKLAQELYSKHAISVPPEYLALVRSLAKGNEPCTACPFCWRLVA